MGVGVGPWSQGLPRDGRGTILVHSCPVSPDFSFSEGWRVRLRLRSPPRSVPMFPLGVEPFPSVSPRVLSHGPLFGLPFDSGLTHPGTYGRLPKPRGDPYDSSVPP